MYIFAHFVNSKLQINVDLTVAMLCESKWPVLLSLSFQINTLFINNIMWSYI